MNLVENKNTYVYYLYHDALEYLQKVAAEKKYTTPIVEFYNKILETIAPAKDTGRKKIFMDKFSDRIRNTKTCSRSQARLLLNVIARCMNVDPSVLMPKVNPADVKVNLLTEPEKEVITADELKRKANFYGYVDLFSETI